MFLRIEENKSCILPPWEFVASMGVVFWTYG